MRVLSIISIVLFLFSCNKKDGLVKFNIDNTASVTVPASTGINLPISLATPEQETNIESEVEANDSRIDKIETIYLEQLTLTITSPANEDFSFLNSMTVILSADGLSDIEIGSIENIPNNPGKFLELETTDKDLSAYIKKKKIKLKTDVSTDEAISQDVDIDVYTDFLVTTNLVN